MFIVVVKKFEKENITNCRYENFPIPGISQFTTLLEQHPELNGINVTIPYKEAVIPFLDELSKVYRYLLRNNEDGLSTVENEMKFIESYFQLMNTRYGEGINANIRIDKKYFPYLVPSLSMQLLVENAIKHNVVSRESPLSIEIFTTEGRQLVVNNNLNKNNRKGNSTRIGLQNIESKYKLMKQDGFQVVNGEKNFMVVLPMIWNSKKTL